VIGDGAAPPLREGRFQGRLAALALVLLAVVLPMIGWVASPAGLVGYAGVGRGEFENWAWTDWWIPRLARCRLDEHRADRLAQTEALLAIPRDLDIGNYADGLLVTQPLKRVLGPVAGHDVRVLVILLLNALAAGFACREAAASCPEGRGRDPLRSVLPAASSSRGRAARDGVLPVVTLAALAIALDPVTLWDIAESRFAQALLAPALLYAGLMLRWLRTPTLGRAVQAALALALTGLCYWYAALFMAALALSALAIRPDRWRPWALHVLVAVALMLGFALPFLAGGRPSVPLGTPFPPLSEVVVPGPAVLGPPGPGLIVAQSTRLTAPLSPPLGPAIPWPWVVLAVISVISDRARPPRSPAGASGPPGRLPPSAPMPEAISPSAAPADGGAFAPRPRWPAAFLACAAAGLVFALGPYLKWADRVVDIRLPYALLYRWIPFVWRLNWPARTLPYVLGALILASIPFLLRKRRPAASAALLVLAVLPTVAAGLLPLPVSPLTVPPTYRAGLPGNPRDGVYEATLPINSSLAAWYQSWHGHPLLGGEAVCPEEAGWTRDPGQVAANPLVRGLFGSPPIWREEGLDALRRGGVGWLVVQRTYGGTPLPNAREVEEVVRRHLGPPLIDDGQMAAWRLAAGSGAAAEEVNTR
jgi:hypothetical protein